VVFTAIEIGIELRPDLAIRFTNVLVEIAIGGGAELRICADPCAPVLNVKYLLVQGCASIVCVLLLAHPKSGKRDLRQDIRQ